MPKAIVLQKLANGQLPDAPMQSDEVALYVDGNGQLRTFGAHGNYRPEGLFDSKFKSITSAEYTITFFDVEKFLEVEQTCQLIIPEHSKSPIPIGAQVPCVRKTSGVVQIVPSDGVQMLSIGGADMLRDENSMATLIKRAENTWYLVGDIST